MKVQLISTLPCPTNFSCFIYFEGNTASNMAGYFQMDRLIQSPIGLREIALSIFDYLDFETLASSKQVNRCWYIFLEEHRHLWIKWLHFYKFQYSPDFENPLLHKRGSKKWLKIIDELDEFGQIYEVIGITKFLKKAIDSKTVDAKDLFSKENLKWKQYFLEMVTDHSFMFYERGSSKYPDSYIILFWHLIKFYTSKSNLLLKIPNKYYRRGAIICSDNESWFIDISFYDRKLAIASLALECPDQEIYDVIFDFISITYNKFYKRRHSSLLLDKAVKTADVWKVNRMIQILPQDFKCDSNLNDSKDNRYCPFSSALHTGNLQIIRLIILKTHLDAKLSNGIFPFEAAVKIQNIEIVKVILEFLRNANKAIPEIPMHLVKTEAFNRDLIKALN